VLSFCFVVFTRVHTSKQLQSHEHRPYQDLSDSGQEINKQQQNPNPARSQMEIQGLDKK
jgi:hypothetical protein